MTRKHGVIPILILASILLTACNSDANDSEPSSESNPEASASVSEETSIHDAVCPTTSDNAEKIVTLFSIPVAARADLNASGFALSFTNALNEVVSMVDEDADSTPCGGFEELFAMVEKWSDLTIAITESPESELPTDQELQEIADLGNEWLSAIEREDLKFSLTADPANIGN